MKIEDQLEAMNVVEDANRGPLTNLLVETIGQYYNSVETPGRQIGLPDNFDGAFKMRIENMWIQAITASYKLFESAKANNPLNYLQQYRDTFGSMKIAGMRDALARDLRDTIAKRQAQGKPLEEILRDLRVELPALADARAATIVRTETHSSFQYGSFRSAMSSGKSLKKKWNTVNDQRTRDFGLSGTVSSFSHRVMDGIAVALDLSFQVPMALGGVEAIMFPGDPSGSPGNIINCRCVQTYEEIS